MKVIKIGGNVIDDPQALARFEADFARMPGEKVLVHGGGKLATALSKTLGIETRMVAGRRVTDRQTLDVVTMVYAGLINKNVVAALQAQGCNAIGMSGADAGAILSHRRTTGEVDYGFVGDVDRVDAEGILALSRAGFTPVFCAITHDGQGSLLNTNADTVASEIAKALAARVETELVFCFEKPGVLSDPEDDTSVIARIDAAAFERLRAEGTVSGGMLYDTSILKIVRGQRGTPGELSGMITYSDSHAEGVIRENTSRGIFGQAEGRLLRMLGTETVEVAFKQEVRTGRAVLRSSVSGELKDYEIQIQELRMNESDVNKGMIFYVTDPDLLALTGGVIQGMSGSPILQNGRLIGAVTHVFVNDPAKGYGIFAENMIEH